MYHSSSRSTSTGFKSVLHVKLTWLRIFVFFLCPSTEMSAYNIKNATNTSFQMPPLDAKLLTSLSYKQFQSTVAPVQTMKAYGGGERYSSTHSLPCHYIKVSGQLHAPAIIVPVPIEQVDRQILDVGVKNNTKICCPCEEWSSGPSSPKPRHYLGFGILHKVKGKNVSVFSFTQRYKDVWGSGSTAPSDLCLDGRWRLLVSHPDHITPGEKTSTVYREGDWVVPQLMRAQWWKISLTSAQQSSVPKPGPLYWLDLIY
jgi:hypothetical protein